MIPQVELLDPEGLVDPGELDQVAAALKQQIDEDLVPTWGAGANVSVGADGGTPGAWTITIASDLPPTELGVHLDDQSGQPYARIEFGQDWSITASHELLEMLVDPYGSRLVLAPSIDPADGGKMVQYLVEIGDPVETKDYLKADVMVSDFVLQDYYHRQPHPNDRYDTLAQVDAPYEVLPGGYISWFDPLDSKWHQKTPDGQFITAAKKTDLANVAMDFRDSRDKAFGGVDPDWHNLRKIRRMDN